MRSKTEKLWIQEVEYSALDKVKLKQSQMKMKECTEIRSPCQVFSQASVIRSQCLEHPVQT